LPLPELYAWGAGSFGRLGNDAATNKSSPVQVGSLSIWQQVSGGGSFSAAVTTSGALFTWGRNTQGQLGLGDVANGSSPVQVGSLTTWYQVSAGPGDFAAAVKTDGTMWAWGRNNNGQLGDNTVVYKSSPVQVGALTNWAQVQRAKHAIA
jgi:alpha-tubulin suppressor-like RCC1 family protein